MRQDLLKEGHLEEIITICVDAYFTPWLTPKQAWEELNGGAKVGHFGTKLNPAQRKAIAALVTEGTITAAAAAVGVSRRTVHRWLQNPDFRAALAAAEGQAMQELSRALVRLSQKAIKVIEGKLDEGELKAADVNLRHLLKYFEIATIEREIAELEQERESWEEPHDEKAL